MGEELEEYGIKYGRVEEDFEVGQGPHRAVEPMMMMMMMMMITTTTMRRRRKCTYKVTFELSCVQIFHLDALSGLFVLS
jgi:hypothetical protein